MSSVIRVRPYESRDREVVRDICWQTAQSGEQVEREYPDRESWVDMYTSYYTDEEPQSCFVAVSDSDRVLGYLLGCVDTRAARSEFSVGLRHNLVRFLWARPGTAGFWWRAGWDVVSNVSGPHRPRVDPDRYPAHMHCNLLPEAHGRGVAGELFREFHGYLRAQRVAGAFGEAYASNLAVHGLLAKLGYEKLGEPYLVPGVRTPQGGRQLGQVMVISL
ncbi:MAG: hypothetical protein QM778_05910 [Myxococcales bacterium]